MDGIVKKLCSLGLACLLALAVPGAARAGEGNAPPPAEPPDTATTPEAARLNLAAPGRVEEIKSAANLTALSVESGAVVSGTAADLEFADLEFADLEFADLEFADQKSLELSGGADGVILDAEFSLPAAASLELFLSAKAAAASEGGVSLYNFAAGRFDRLQTIALTTRYASYSVQTAGLAPYLSGGVCRVRVQAAGALTLDALCVTAVSREAGGMVHAYDVQSAAPETGSAVAGSVPASLADRDGKYYEVNSDGNKAAWSATLRLDEDKADVAALELAYAGKFSAAANTLWISLYRNDTKNWEAVSTAPGSTALSTASVVISDSARLASYIADDGTVKVRLYNSAPGSFVRQTDLLRLTAYTRPAANTVKLAPDAVVAETGAVTGGAAELEYRDGEYLASASAGNKCAVQMKFHTDVDKDKLFTLTLSLNTRVSRATNNAYISLYNYTTGNFSAFRTITPSTRDETIRFSVTDPVELDRYISPEGEITLRVYNSAPAAFTRSIDYAEALLEYGDFQSFEIAQISDVHELIGSANFQAIIGELNKKVNPDLVIMTGDLTDHGTPAQYDLYKRDAALLECPVYTTPGNHDVRWWNSNGKNDFVDRIGPLYQSFDHKGVHFVLLDSTVNLELDGKINKAQLEWLRADLAALPAGTPVMLFAHHPFKINNNVTARHELLDAVKDYNVIAYMTGHVHYYGNVVENGVPVNYITYVKDNAEQNYVTIKFTERNYFIYKHKASDGSKALWLSGKMDNTRKTRFAIESAQPAANGDLAVRVRVDDAPDGVASVKARIDNYGPYTALTLGADGLWAGTLRVSAYQPVVPYGKHFAGVEVTDGLGGNWTGYRDYDWLGGPVSSEWVFETGDMIQAPPTVLDGRVYVGSNDGNLYCVDDADGRELWRFGCGDGVTSKPAVYAAGASKSVLFGSNDKKLYSLDAATGALQWSYTTGGSVISDPLVAGDTVVFGSGDGKIYALDAATGAFRWAYQTGGLMRQRPVVQDGVLYAFVRDTYIWYALNLADGSLKWRGNANTDESLFVCGDVRPVIAGGKLWCIDAQNTRPGALDFETGELVWFPAGISNVSSRGPATDGTLVFYAGNSGRSVYAFRAADGSPAWTADLRYGTSDSDLQEMQIDSGLVYENGVLWHVAERGRISALDPATGGRLVRYDAAGYPERVFWSTPEASGSRVYASGIDGKLYCVEWSR